MQLAKTELNLCGHSLNFWLKQTDLVLFWLLTDDFVIQLTIVEFEKMNKILFENFTTQPSVLASSTQHTEMWKTIFILCWYYCWWYKVTGLVSVNQTGVGFHWPTWNGFSLTKLKWVFTDQTGVGFHWPKWGGFCSLIKLGWVLYELPNLVWLTEPIYYILSKLKLTENEPKPKTNQNRAKTQIPKIAISTKNNAVTIVA